MKNILLFCSIVLLMSCRNNNKENAEKNIESSSDSVLTVTNPGLESKIKILKIIPEPYREKIITSGIVKAIPNNYAEIASPFSGRITRSFVCLGQKVEVDSPVFEISSPVFFEAGKAYYQTKQEMLLAEKNLKRQKDLLTNGVGTQKDLDEAEVTFELTKRDFENSIASLKVYHVNPEELVLGQPLIVRSPIKGEIVENNIVIGQYLKEDAEPVAIVAELSKVWVIGQLKEKDITLVHESDEAEIRLTGMAEVPVRGTVFHIGEILDEDTRSVQVYVLCKNSDRIMKPGMFVTTTFSESSENAIIIPASSLFQTEQSSFVFIRLANNKYLRRKVEVSSADSNRVIIRSGLNAGDEIVIEGGILLTDLKN
jgi:cobalt-zinc-cadmium efflux system membrane fusion protein